MAENEEGKVDDVDNGKVSVDKESLEKMLEDMAELKSKNMELIEKVSTRESKDAELEAQRVQYDEQQRKQQTGKIDVSKMSKEEFFQTAVQTALDQVREEVAQPLLNMVMTVIVDREVEKAKTKHEDFEQFKDDIFELASKNDKLTIEQAYNLAKSNKQEKDAKVPKKETPEPDPGQRPGPSPKTMQKSGKLTIEEAAEKARSEIYKNVDTGK
jgi:hypothetical protein